mmetsp:Transcript_10684/g.28000  ORF Transcript_10684/g.28000 Transcript_10684/m.28000 type:complete len:112 (+) Transcript_10684:927-1262(+)
MMHPHSNRTPSIYVLFLYNTISASHQRTFAGLTAYAVRVSGRITCTVCTQSNRGKHGLTERTCVGLHSSTTQKKGEEIEGKTSSGKTQCAFVLAGWLKKGYISSTKNALKN